MRRMDERMGNTECMKKPETSCVNKPLDFWLSSAALYYFSLGSAGVLDGTCKACAAISDFPVLFLTFIVQISRCYYNYFTPMGLLGG